MTDYVIYTRGLRGPSISVLRGRSILNEHDRKNILSGPTPLAPEHADLSLSEISKLYPPPTQKPEGGDPVNAPKPPTKPSPLPPAEAAISETAK